MFKHSRNAVGGFLAAALVTAAALSAARQVRAQTGPAFTQGGPPLTVSIISPANGGGTPGQTLQAGVFAITNNLDFTQIVNSVTIAFTNPSMFSSATLKPFSPNGASGQHDVTGTLSFPTVSRPVASTTFTFSSPEFIGPGSQPVFALTVKLSPLSRNEPGNTAYAGMITRDGLRGAGAPLWMAFAMLGLATAALPGGKRRRVWLLAG